MARAHQVRQEVPSPERLTTLPISPILHAKRRCRGNIYALGAAWLMRLCDLKKREVVTIQSLVGICRQCLGDRRGTLSRKRTALAIVYDSGETALRGERAGKAVFFTVHSEGVKGVGARQRPCQAQRRASRSRH